MLTVVFNNEDGKFTLYVLEYRLEQHGNLGLLSPASCYLYHLKV